MPHEFAFDPDRGLARLTARGVYGAGDIMAMLTAFRDDPRLRAGMDLLADLRQATFTLGGDDLRRLLRAMVESSAQHGAHRTAVVVSSPLMFGLSRQVASYLDVFRMPATFQIFYDLAAAEAWLAQAGPASDPS
jgi:hypothetical protein